MAMALVNTMQLSAPFDSSLELPRDDRDYVEHHIKQICAEALRIDVKELDQEKSLLLQGGDSLLAIKIMARCRVENIGVNIVDLIEAKNMTELYHRAQLLVPGNPLTQPKTVRDGNMAVLPMNDSSNDSVLDQIQTTSTSDFTIADKLKHVLHFGRHEIRSIIPCSSTQESMLICQSTSPNMYQCCYVLKFSSDDGQHQLNSRRFGAAWTQVIKRHSSLRTVLVESPHRLGHYEQVILDNITPSIQYYEGTQHLSSPDFSPHKAVTFSQSDIPHCAQFVQASPTEVFMKLEISHVIIDGQSAEVLLRDLCKGYNGTEIAAPAVSYAEFSSAPGLTQTPASLGYWADYLSDAAETSLPMDRGHEKPSNLETVSLEMVSDQGFQQNLVTIPGLTMAVVCQLAWALVLRCFTGSDHVCFSYATSGRTASVDGLQDAVGPFVEPRICCIKLESSREIEEALLKLAKEILVAPSQPSIAEMGGGRGQVKSGRQLGNTTLSYQRALDQRAANESGIAATVIGKSNPTDYDIALYISSRHDGLTIDLDFWSSRMDRPRANTILSMFREAIRSILRTANGTVSDVNTLSRWDVEKLESWNNRVPAASRTCIHDKVAEVVRRQPGNAAVCAWDGTLSYQELHSQAATLAHYLVEVGVAPETMVGLCISKSKWAIVAMLAILQAGGVVVPLGVTHPVARIRGLLDDTAAKVLLVDEKQSSRLSGLAEIATMTTVNATLLASLPTKSEPTTSAIRPDNAAWVIFTSGSTGTPKGVILEHANISTSLLAHGSLFGVGPATRAAQFAAFTFDVSISDIFMTLYFGGCICVFSEESRMSNLAEALRSLRVNFVDLTPTVLGLLDPSDVPEVQTVAAGGEPLDPEIVNKWSTHAKVFNTYGPSECTIMSVCNGPVTDPKQASNIGYPIGTRLWVTEINNPDKLCPIGVPGELLIEGPMVSRGYLNDEMKTAASFVYPAFARYLTTVSSAWSNQFGPTGTRMYRSGDLVRQNDDGSLTHLGRWDTQVKIRGQRVEIGEIESCIMQHLKGARLAAVVVSSRGQRSEQKSLVAVIELEHVAGYCHGPVNAVGNLDKVGSQDGPAEVLHPNVALTETFHQLQASLFEALPHYMVPNMFVPVSSMPLNPSGKLDRQAVRLLVSSLSTEQLQCYLPNSKTRLTALTDTERKLQTLWAKVLGTPVDQVGADDHFFHIGGDSVAAMRAVAAGRDMRLQMTVADVYRHPRLSGLAQMLDSEAMSWAEPEALDDPPFALWKKASGVSAEVLWALLHEVAAHCDLEATQIEDIYPATSLQEGLLALTARQPSAYVNRQAYSVSSNVDIDRFRAAWQTVVATTAILRTRILFGQQSGPLQVVMRGELPWQEGSSLDAYLEADRAVGMAPGQPLNRFALIEEASGQRFFVWTGHHSTYDGWSRSLVLRQVAGAYLYSTAPPIIPYTRFIRYLTQADPETAARYWREQLQGDVMADYPPLPRAKYQPRPQQRLCHEINLPAKTRNDVLTSDILRAAWAILIAHHTGHENPVFAVALSGRDAPVPGITDLVAPTITTVPVRIRVDQRQTVQELLHSVHQQAIEMMPYVHTGLHQIKQLAPDLTAALELRHLFLVQPAVADAQGLDIPGVEALSIPHGEFDSYGLNVECTLGVSTVAIDVRFDTAMIATVQVQRIMNQFGHVLQQLCDPAEMEKPLGSIDLVSPQDIEQIRSWNGSVSDPVQRCLHDLVADMETLQPDASAIEAWDGYLTYRQLRLQAASLARHLVQLGVGPEVFVGVCMNKSVWTCVAFLAILEAGGAVVPLGVSHPPTRIQNLLSQTAAKVVLVDQAQASRLARLHLANPSPAQVMPPMITVDSKLVSALPLPNGDRGDSRALPENAAWVIFTSGSTGTPKGVVLEHRALCTSLLAHGTRFGMNSGTRTIQFAAHTFDAVIQDYFTTLVHGGTVCVPSENDRMNDLCSVMKSMEVNFCNLTSTVARLLTPADVPTLETMVLAGEPVQAAALELWYKHVDVINCYGPAECSIDSTSTYKKRLASPSEAMSIGFPLASRIWITEPTDPNQLCAIRAPGEMLIEGPLLGRGYLNDKDKTAVSFLTDPEFTKRLGLGAGCRMYRTGDLARQNEDGSFTHLGRIDSQVKIRGQRVEIGEIEYWISQKLQDTRGVAVVATDRGDGQQRGLAAVIEFSDQSVHRGPHIDAAFGLRAPSEPLQQVLHQLQVDLLEVLPTYMVPNMIIPVAQLPLNTSGKLDRRAVSTLVEGIDAEQRHWYLITGNDRAKVSPSTETERQLQAAWAEALGTEIELVGADDHLFQLGGDSVVAMRIVAAARSGHYTHLRDVTVADVFERPRLSELASLLDSRGTAVEKTRAESSHDEDAPFSMWMEAVGLEV